MDKTALCPKTVLCPMCKKHPIIYKTEESTLRINEEDITYMSQYCHCSTLDKNDPDRNFIPGRLMSRNMLTALETYNKIHANYNYEIRCAVKCEIRYDKDNLAGMTESQAVKILTTAYETAPACDIVKTTCEIDVENCKCDIRGLFIYKVDAANDAEACKCAKYAFSSADKGVFKVVGRGEFYINSKTKTTAIV